MSALLLGFVYECSMGVEVVVERLMLGSGAGKGVFSEGCDGLVFWKLCLLERVVFCTGLFQGVLLGG